MKLHISKGLFRCGKRTCRKAVSIRAQSFFCGHKLPCSRILFLGWLWLNNVPVSSMIAMSGHGSESVCAFQAFFRQLVSDSVEIETATIGGPNIIVEIDETKLGKRKYNREHRVDGVWVVGGVERTLERRIFLVEVQERTKETLFEIIQRHVNPGSIIHTDLWRGYTGLRLINGYQHHTVNHSMEFIVPNTTIHTNTIEGTWNGLKMQIHPRNRNADVEDHLWEFIWRRKNKGRLWEAFIEALKEIEYT
jgi:transposase-like protein